MCQMYAIFEEVVGPQPTVTFSKNNKNAQKEDDEDQGIVVTTNNHHSAADPDSSDSLSHYAPSKVRSSSKHQRTYGSSSYLRKYSTLPRRRPPSSTGSSSDLDDVCSVSSSNPLLDTISVLTYDPPDDSDDYYDLTDGCEQCPSKEEEKASKSSTAVVNGTEGDRDSVGYAGSSSIDSGYKSFCPTPEIPDSSVYGTEVGNRTNLYSGYYGDSSQSRNSKPRIMMGTKVMSRQGQVTREPSVRPDISLYDVNLDHLMYLRQSLLSAIQKCESSRSESADEKKKDSQSAENPVEDQNYVDVSPTKTPQSSYQKTVRFSSNVKVSTVNSHQPPNEGSEANTSEQMKVQSKSILKDPLCANLRSQLESGTSGDCSLEKEIDSLLYGRAEFYDLESVDDFPCSYVTMIEEKYRSGKPSLAKVRKLKNGKVQEANSKSTSTLENEQPSPEVEGEDDTRQLKISKEPASSATVSISKTAKCRFTEVARCMLEIIEDLQMKKLQPENDKDPSGHPPSVQAEDSSSGDNAGDDSKSEYTTAAEYHVYEEIDYDYVGNVATRELQKRLEIPPPLPARPIAMLQRPEYHRNHKNRAPSPPPRKGRCLLKRSNYVNEGIELEVRNRPKQRGNLYCLFADRAIRRNISRSLEREWRVTGSSDNQEDDYGFRKEFPSI